MVCKVCGKHFQACYRHRLKAQPELKRCIHQALFEKISLRGIACIFRVSLDWVQKFACQTWRQMQAGLHINWQRYQGQYIEIQLDEF